ncbi:oligoendopeptidase F [Spirochaetia bacterium]|nr:oligoendopeptidase F [Spirochaetia bacterium]
MRSGFNGFLSDGTAGGPGGEIPPRWNLDSVYPSFDSAKYRGDMKALETALKGLLDLLAAPIPAAADPAAQAILALLRAYEEAAGLAITLFNYTEAVYSTDTRDARALAEINALAAASLPLRKAGVLFNNRLAEQRDLALQLTETVEALKPYRFFIRTALEEAAFQMEPDLEDLANDLARSGGDAWSRLHSAVTANASAVWDHATGERKTATVLRELAYNPDRSLRERAYKAELDAWKSAEIPIAAALNGVKGVSITLNTRQGWRKAALSGGAGAEPADAASRAALLKSGFQSRLSYTTLQALIGALEKSLPIFRRFLKAKASLLGLPALAFYDIFAPVGGNAGRAWSWKESSDFITEQFGDFDPKLGEFARRAFANNWIDAESREGKIGGGFCTGFPRYAEPRVLVNFGGSFDSVSTVAHELGHAWHFEVLKDLPVSRTQYPMTLAETASIFAETIIFEGALAKADNAAERLGIIELDLKDSCHVTMDILSRFYFERELFNRRDKGELSPGELCGIMTDAQLKTYGDALDPKLLHPYMWAVKTHYYNPNLNFYNYPYAFGLLFALGLYARYQKEGKQFVPVYGTILRLTGQASVEDVAKEAGFDLAEERFWQGALDIFTRRVSEYEKLAADSRENTR